MGGYHFFGTDGEVVVVNDGVWLDAFDPGGDYMTSWDLSKEGEISDVTSGNFTGKRPRALAVALKSSTKVRVGVPGSKPTTIDVGRYPRALAAGDVNGDGTDELVAFGNAGGISICDVPSGKCGEAVIEGVGGKDVAVADVDGDGYDEPVFLIDNDGDTQLIVYNTDHEATGQKESLGWSLGFGADSMAAGDLDGDGVAEVVLHEDKGWHNWVSDNLKVFSPSKEQITISRSIHGHTIDIAVGDRNADGKDEIAALRDGEEFEVLRYENGAIESVGTHDVTVGGKVSRLALVDWDGDTPSGKLVEGPELVAGEAVPVAVLMFPPFPYKAAVGTLSADIALGKTESTDEALRDTLSLHVGIGVSFGADIGVFKSKVGLYLSKDKTFTKIHTRKQTVGARYSVLAQPDLHGTGYAPVITSCGCYHRYRYETEDPADKMGGSGQTVDIFVPVGGQTQLWSSKRYNAMAEATGTLPIIEVPVRVGDVGSYPTTPQTLDGTPIPEEDMLFVETPSYQVSDVGYVSFVLVSGESETNDVAEKTTLGMQASFGAFGASVDVDASVGVETGYSITVGSETIFAGGVPPVPDDPETPEDEYLVHRYSFQPLVYRQHYQDAAGEDAAYYVLHFAAGQ
jgi:hypothetical protein